MSTVMSQETLRQLVDKVAREVTERVAGVRLAKEEGSFTGERYTVHITFTKGVHYGLALCAELPIYTRMTQYMMQETEVTSQDIEDFSKEYFNVVCGHIAAEIYKNTKLAARFGVPEFFQGEYVSETPELFTLQYSGERGECVWLTCYAPAKE